MDLALATFPTTINRPPFFKCWTALSTSQWISINETNCIIQGLNPFLNKKFKDFSRTFTHISIFQRLHSVEKRASMYFLTLPEHEQIYPEGLSVFAPFPLGWIKLAPKFTNFPAVTSFSRTFKALNFYFKIQGLPRCLRTLAIQWIERKPKSKGRMEKLESGTRNPESGAGNGTGTRTGT